MTAEEPAKPSQQHAHDEAPPDVAPADYWEERYADADRVWSGNVNPAIAAITPDLPRGTALDLGCGEGGDAVWLASHGWQVTAVDISRTAVERGATAARERGIADDEISFVAADVSTWDDGRTYDLVTASYLHSPVQLSRTEVLRRAADRVAPGGHLLIVSHGSLPPWAPPRDNDDHAHDHREFRTARDELAELALDDGKWDVVLAESRPRDAAGPDGERAVIDDEIVLLRRG